MKHAWSQYRSFDTTVRLLLVNQLTINLGFYMLMPYLAAHLSGGLALATWAVGLVLGVRNLSQQGMFLIGGMLADRFGHKPLIVAGCTLRTVGFAALAFAESLPALIAASAATGLAGALFNPAVRAYLAAEAGAERRVDAFALFNVFYQTGILLGPLLGLALTSVSFPTTCAVAATLFAGLTLLQLRRLPENTVTPRADRPALREQAGTVLRNRPFWLFSLAMTGSYVLSFQVYLALPLETEQRAGGGAFATTVTSALFVVSGLVALVGQLRITAWCTRAWTPARCLTAGTALMGAAFLPPLLTAGSPPSAGGWSAALAVTPLLLCGGSSPWPPPCSTRSRWTPSSPSPEAAGWRPTTACTTPSAGSASPSGTSPSAPSSTPPAAWAVPPCPGWSSPCSAAAAPRRSPRSAVLAD